jgi:hypothetical protein
MSGSSIAVHGLHFSCHELISSLNGGFGIHVHTISYHV